MAETDYAGESQGQRAFDLSAGRYATRRFEREERDPVMSPVVDALLVDPARRENSASQDTREVRIGNEALDVSLQGKDYMRDSLVYGSPFALYCLVMIGDGEGRQKWGILRKNSPEGNSQQDTLTIAQAVMQDDGTERFSEMTEMPLINGQTTTINQPRNETASTVNLKVDERGELLRISSDRKSWVTVITHADTQILPAPIEAHIKGYPR